MMKTMRRHLDDRGPERGFTLIEVLVVIALLAALVAIVAPQLFNQLDKGDATQVTSDLGSVATGVKSFRVDVSPKFPGDIEDLVSSIATSENGLDGNPYNNGQTRRWSGPYLEVDLDAGVAATSDTAFATGFGGQVINGFSQATPTGGSGPWITVTVRGVSTSGCDVIETQVDDGSYTDGRYECAGGDLTYYAVQK